MEVRFSHGNAHWGSHTAFHAFRRRLAELVEIKIDEMDGFGGTVLFDFQREPLGPLLAMSDVDGVIGAPQLDGCSHRLGELMARLVPDSDDYRSAYLLLIGMRVAMSRNEPFRVVRRADIPTRR